MDVQGKIIAILPLRKGTSAKGTNWQTQEYVLETQEQYPKRICFEVYGDKIQKLNISMGEVLTASIDIDAREYNGRWYNSIKCWNIQRLGYAPQPQSAVPNARPYTPQPNQTAASQQSSDLPF